MNAPTRLGCGLVLLWAASALGAPPTTPMQHIDSPLGVSFDLPAGWIEAPSDAPWVQRFIPPACASDPDAIADCPSFLVLQRMAPLQDADAMAMSRRRAQAMQAAWKSEAEGMHEGGGAWRVGRYTLGPIDAMHVVTDVLDGTVGWALTGWSTPADAAAMRPVYMAAGASLRVQRQP